MQLKEPHNIFPEYSKEEYNKMVSAVKSLIDESRDFYANSNDKDKLKLKLHYKDLQKRENIKSKNLIKSKGKF